MTYHVKNEEQVLEEINKIASTDFSEQFYEKHPLWQIIRIENENTGLSVMVLYTSSLHTILRNISYI